MLNTKLVLLEAKNKNLIQLDYDFRDLQFCKIRAIYTHKALFPVCRYVSLLIFGFSESALLLIINAEGVTGKRTISRMVTMA